MKFYLLRKHPPNPFGCYPDYGHLEAFTIAGIYSNHAEAHNEAKEKNKRSRFLYTVKRIELKDAK